jgi:hypothetical protein
VNLKQVSAIAIAAAITCFGPAALANTVSSQDPDCNIAPELNHVFTATATTVSKCLYAGGGNINGNPNDGGASADADMIADGFTFIGDASVTGLGTGAGTFSIAAGLYSTYDQIAIGFKSGVNLDIDYAIFLFDPGTLGGTWTVTPPQGGGLSHAIMWGIGDGNGGGGGNGNGGGMPEPGTLALAGIALLGAAAARRRQRR